MDEALEAEIQALVGQPLDNDDRETLQYLREHIRSVTGHAAEQTAAMSRWLLASLLAVNGGAIIAVLNSTEIGGPQEQWAIIAWLAGIILALVSGLLAMFNGQRAISVAAEMMTELTKTLIGGVWRDVRFDAQEKELKQRGTLAVRVGILSMIAFVVGAVAAAI